MNTQDEDKNIKKLFKAHGSVKPNADFTNQIMHSIQNLSTGIETSNNKMNWTGYSLIFAGSVAVSSLVYFLLFGNGAILWSEYDPIIFPIFKNIWLSLKDVFVSVQISSVTIIILIGFLTLILAERLLRKFQSGKSTFLLI